MPDSDPGAFGAERLGQREQVEQLLGQGGQERVVEPLGQIHRILARVLQDELGHGKEGPLARALGEERGVRLDDDSAQAVHVVRTRAYDERLVGQRPAHAQYLAVLRQDRVHQASSRTEVVADRRLVADPGAGDDLAVRGTFDPSDGEELLGGTQYSRSRWSRPLSHTPDRISPWNRGQTVSNEDN